MPECHGIACGVELQAAKQGGHDAFPVRKCLLIVQPGDSFFPIEHAIDAAESEICATVYKMDCPVIGKAFQRAAARGVRVRVILSSRVKDDPHANQELREKLSRSGVEVSFPAGELGSLSRYHAKLLLVDRRMAIVCTFNPTQASLHAYRDFGLEIEDREVVGALQSLFEGDWRGEEVKISVPWIAVSPGLSRGPIQRLLSRSSKRIWIYDAKLGDAVILDTLTQKIDQGVDVRLITSGESRNRLPAGIRSHTLTRIHLHAKLALVDDRYFFLGSQNFQAEYFDRRRELGVLIESPALAAELAGIFYSDWGDARERETGFETVTFESQSAGDEGFVLMSRRHSKLRFPLSKGVHSIGRSKESKLRLDHPAVSRRHADLVFDGRKFLLVDFSSKGTWLNGEQVHEAREMSEGDVINFGGWEEFRLLRL